MLGKLLKQEFKATYKNFVSLYIALFLILFVSLGLNKTGIDAEFLNVILMLSFVAVAAAICVVILIVIISRFDKSLYGQEGYLTFTLPVTESSIVLTKLITSFVWILLSGMAFLLCAYIVLLYLGEINWSDFNEFMQMIRQMIQSSTISQILMVIAAIIEGILFLYFLITFTNLSFINRFRIPIGIVLYALINTVVTRLKIFAVDKLANAASYLTFANIELVLSLIFIVLFFTVTVYLMKKHLIVR